VAVVIEEFEAAKAHYDRLGLATGSCWTCTRVVTKSTTTKVWPSCAGGCDMATFYPNADDAPAG